MILIFLREYLSEILVFLGGVMTSLVPLFRERMRHKQTKAEKRELLNQSIEQTKKDREDVKQEIIESEIKASELYKETLANLRKIYREDLKSLTERADRRAELIKADYELRLKRVEEKYKILEKRYENLKKSFELYKENH